MPAVALAWLFSGGSVNDKWVPAFAVKRRTRWLAEDVLDALDGGHSARHGDSDGRATEAIPAEDASALGRMSVTLGAPQGSKGMSGCPCRRGLPTHRNPVGLRANVRYEPGGTPRDERSRHPVPFREEPGPEYRSALRQLFESLVNGQAVAGKSEMLYLTMTGAARLNQYPTI